MNIFNLFLLFGGGGKLSGGMLQLLLYGEQKNKQYNKRKNKK